MDINYEIVKAKDGSNTLKINNVFIYSKYSPLQDAKTFIDSEYNKKDKKIVLFGLGLGYHFKALLEIDSINEIILVPITGLDEKIFSNYFSNNDRSLKNVKLVRMNNLEEIDKINEYQIIVPYSWLAALEKTNDIPLKLKEIKIRQMSFTKDKAIMQRNFERNLTENFLNIECFKDKFKDYSVCLVSAGPSLNDNIAWLKEISHRTIIVSVGSAWKVLKDNRITPDFIIITDPLIEVEKQIISNSGNEKLLFLSTSSHEAVIKFQGKKFLLLQEGFEQSEKYAKENQLPVFKTGGSVATTAISIIEYFGFDRLCFFGQDLGFFNTYTHAEGSTSKKIIADKQFIQVQANNGKMINTTDNLVVYKNWIENKIKKSEVQFFNSAMNGAIIEGATLVDFEKFKLLF